MSDVTPKTIIEGDLTTKLADHPEKVEGLEAIYLFDLTGDNGGKWTLTCDGKAAAISEGEQGEIQCTFSSYSRNSYTANKVPHRFPSRCVASSTTLYSPE